MTFAEPKYAVIAIVWLAYIMCLAAYGFRRLFDYGESGTAGCFVVLALVALTVTACAVLMME